MSTDHGWISWDDPKSVHVYSEVIAKFIVLHMKKKIHIFSTNDMTKTRQGLLIVFTTIDIKWISLEHQWQMGLCFFFVCRASRSDTNFQKNIYRHTADTIVSWPNLIQWAIVHTSYLMMMIRQSICILSTITTEMGKLKTYSLTYNG